MTISFPIQCPTHLAPASVRWTATTAVTVSTSPTSLQTIKYAYDGEAWLVDVAYPPLKREEAAPFFAFLAALRCQQGTFMFGDTLLDESLGTPLGAPKLNGANQVRTKTLVTDGWNVSTTVLKGGDFIQVDQRLYMVLKDVVSDSEGNAEIEIFPKCREHADNASIITSSPKGLFRLSPDSQVVVEAGNNQLFNISFQATEAL